MPDFFFVAIENDRYTQIANAIIPWISSKDQRIIIYLDFVKDPAPLTISLRQAGYSTCSYHGLLMTSWNLSRIGEVVYCKDYGLYYCFWHGDRPARCRHCYKNRLSTNYRIYGSGVQQRRKRWQTSSRYGF